MSAKKIIASVACLMMVATMAPALSQAATAAELQGQIETLQSQLQTLMGQLGGTTTTTTTTTTTNGTKPAVCAGVSFSTNLTIGSTGTDVQCLQAILNMSADTQVSATGAGSPGQESTYFGAKTKTAVAAFQMKNAAHILTPVGLTAGTGFVGASTRAELNEMLVGAETPTTGAGLPTGCTTTAGFSSVTGQSCSSGSTTTTLPAGCTSTTGFSPVTGQACSNTTTTTTTTTNGQEGTITVSVNPSPADNTKVYEGDSKVAVYGLKLKATGSDMDVQRVTLKFSSQPYSYFTNIYLYDGSTQLATAALNSTTVSKVSGTDYEITLANFASKFIVPNNTTKVITVEVDVQSGISSGVWTGTNTSNITINQPNATSVRAVDQAGLNQYSGDTAGRIVSVNASQTSGASLTVSLDANTPKARTVIADASQNITGATLLTFDMKATKDNLLIDSLNATFSATSTYVVPSTAYLYDDSGTVIGTGSPNATTGLVTFTDLNYTISKDTTKTFTIRIDDTLLAPSTSTHISTEDGQMYLVTIAAGTSTTGTTGVIFEKSNGTTSYSTGSAASYVAQAYAEGPIFTIASISTSSTQPSYSGASSSISATFNVQVQAVTGDVYIHTNGATGAFAVSRNTGGTDTALSLATITYVQPSGTVLTTGTTGAAYTAYKVGQGTSATFAVNATYSRTTGSAGYFDLRLMSIGWMHTWVTGLETVVTSTYMADDSNWISQAINLQ